MLHSSEGNNSAAGTPALLLRRKKKCEDAECRDGCVAPLRKTAKHKLTGHNGIKLTELRAITAFTTFARDAASCENGGV
jgi:hypothetical protein